MYQVVYPDVAPLTASLTAGTDKTTKWIPARGARCVMFHWVATNADAMQAGANPTEGCNIDPIAAGSAAQGTTPGAFGALIPATIQALNVGGGVVHTMYPAAGATFIQPAYVRMSIRAHATNPSTNIRCVSATVIYDGDAPPNWLPTPAVAV